MATLCPLRRKKLRHLTPVTHRLKIGASCAVPWTSGQALSESWPHLLAGWCHCYLNLRSHPSFAHLPACSCPDGQACLPLGEPPQFGQLNYNNLASGLVYCFLITTTLWWGMVSWCPSAAAATLRLFF